ncbi:MAG: hypothetical protein LC132_09805 [Burkholderiales bacterium]|nr:hypothetical protein [Burkholderiales bacterium]
MRYVTVGDDVHRASIGTGDHVRGQLVAVMHVETPVQTGNPVYMSRYHADIMGNHNDGNIL